MKIVFDNLNECESAKLIISDHESNEKAKESIGINKIISGLKTAIDAFYINNFDKIGPITCKFCKNTWVAVCSSKSKTLACPSCKMHNTIPDITKK